MRAWHYTSARQGLDKAIRLVPDAAVPVPAARDGGGDVLVRVHAMSLNPADVKLPEMGPLIARLVIRTPAAPGMDFAGVVVSSSSSSSKDPEQRQKPKEGEGEVGVFQPGDRVFGRVEAPTSQGSLGEYVLASPAGLAHLPAGVGMEDGAAVGTAGLTAYQCVVPNVVPGAGDRVFVNGGSGGTGVFGIQIAKALGCEVVASCSGRNAELVRGLGADEVVDYAAEDVVARLREMSRGEGKMFKLVVDNVGGSPADLYSASEHYLAPDGKFVQIGAGSSFGDMRSLMSRALRPGFLGGGRRKWEFFLTSNRADELRRIAGWMAEGKLKAVVDEVFEYEKAPEAVAKLKTGRARGKVVVRVSE
ncbi:NAD(P)-binding protein [Xylariaceae sp. FL0016]|nr:NAD(P)-binding protein [Xylariaceae sp. FL0016]